MCGGDVVTGFVPEIRKAQQRGVQREQRQKEQCEE